MYLCEVKMACGCRKNKSSFRGGAPLRPTTNVRSSSGVSSGGTQLRSQQAQSPSPQLNAGGVSAERRKTQALRRDAIKKAFNK